MPTVSRVLADSDGVRLADADGYYLMVPGETMGAEPPAPPAKVAYDPVTGALSCAWQPDCTEFRFYSNNFAAGEASDGLRTRAVGTVAAQLNTDPALSDGALDDEEHRAYEVTAYDDLYAIEGPPSRPIYSVGANRRL